MPDQEAAAAHEFGGSRRRHRLPFYLRQVERGEVRGLVLVTSDGNRLRAGMLSIGLVDQLLGLFRREGVYLQPKQIRLFCEHPLDLTRYAGQGWCADHAARAAVSWWMVASYSAGLR